MNYWNRIDLHQHTDHDIDCTGQMCTNNYTHLDYFKWLKEEKNGEIYWYKPVIKEATYNAE